MTDLIFPHGFLWGVATSAVQNEGSFRNSTWWAWEQRAGAIHQGDRSGLGCDWWRNAEADFDLAQNMGLNTLRLGVEWSRIEPEEGAFDSSALARYRQMLRALRDRNLEPMITLHHFSDPLWLDEQGGWLNRRTPGLFGRFAARVAEELGDLASLWITINEPLVYVYSGFLTGDWPPGRQALGPALVAANNLLRAHGAAYRAIHARRGRAAVGVANHILHIEPLDPGRASDRLGARLLDWLFNGWSLAAQTDGRLRPPFGLGIAPHGPLLDSVDFMGLNYYSRARVTFDPGGEWGFLGWRLIESDPRQGPNDRDEGSVLGEIYPEGLYWALRRLAAFGKPIYITENGVADRSGRLRPQYLVDHLAQVHRAIAEGVNVRGYYHWTLVDNFEWAEGWRMRFGLIELDVDAQARRPRPSAAHYERICRANGLPAELLNL